MFQTEIIGIQSRVRSYQIQTRGAYSCWWDPMDQMLRSSAPKLPPITNLQSHQKLRDPNAATKAIVIVIVIMGMGTAPRAIARSPTYILPSVIALCSLSIVFIIYKVNRNGASFVSFLAFSNFIAAFHRTGELLRHSDEISGRPQPRADAVAPLPSQDLQPRDAAHPSLQASPVLLPRLPPQQNQQWQRVRTSASPFCFFFRCETPGMPGVFPVDPP